MFGWFYLERKNPLNCVPGAGIEPARSFDREILSLLCLPVSPPGQAAHCTEVFGAMVGGAVTKIQFAAKPEAVWFYFFDLLMGCH